MESCVAALEKHSTETGIIRGMKYATKPLKMTVKQIGSAIKEREIYVKLFSILHLATICRIYNVHTLNIHLFIITFLFL